MGKLESDSDILTNVFRWCVDLVKLLYDFKVIKFTYEVHKFYLQ